MKKLFFLLILTISLSAVLLPAGAIASDEEPWQFGVGIYGWLPNIDGQTAFSQPGGSNDFEVGIDDILDNLEFTLMGTLDVRKGCWGLLTDLIYMSVGGSETSTREATIGGTPLPVNSSAYVNLDVKSWIWTLTGYYRAIEKTGYTLDVVGGARYLDVEQTVNWDVTGNIGSIQPSDRTGAAKGTLSNWDAIIGVRGRVSFGAHHTWFVPYYLDMGTGESDFTWQGITGIGYAFSWGEMSAVWRYLDYDLPSDKAIKDMSFSGPALGITFRW